MWIHLNWTKHNKGLIHYCTVCVFYVQSDFKLSFGVVCISSPGVGTIGSTVTQCTRTTSQMLGKTTKKTTKVELGTNVLVSRPVMLRGWVEVSDSKYLKPVNNKLEIMGKKMERICSNDSKLISLHCRDFPRNNFSLHRLHSSRWTWNWEITREVGQNLSKLWLQS